MGKDNSEERLREHLLNEEDYKHYINRWDSDVVAVEISIRNLFRETLHMENLVKLAELIERFSSSIRTFPRPESESQFSVFSPIHEKHISILWEFDEILHTKSCPGTPGSLFVSTIDERQIKMENKLLVSNVYHQIEMTHDTEEIQLINDIFSRINLIIDSQSEIINNIEYTLIANSLLIRTEDDLNYEGRREKKKWNKKWLLIPLVLIIVIVIVIIIIIV